MKENKILNNKPFLEGQEMAFIQEAISCNFISGNGEFTKRCQEWFREKFHFPTTLLTTSCTDALEMSALLLDLKPGDEVILPSYSFVSVANAFLLHGATLRFADSSPDHPNIDPDSIRSLVNEKTKAIVVIHYAGMAVDLASIMDICAKHNIYLIEDAAHAIGVKYKEKYLGSYGDLSVMSFHESKNITCGEGGCLIINNESFKERAEIILEKGTNRSKFRRGEVNKYEWIDIGASYLLSDINAAMLLGQLHQMEYINEKRRELWSKYYEALKPLEEEGLISLPQIPDGAENHNAHIFYVRLKHQLQRDDFLDWMNKAGIWAIFHYLPLHNSPYYSDKYEGAPLSNAIGFAKTIVRLPLHLYITEQQFAHIINCCLVYFDKLRNKVVKNQ